MANESFVNRIKHEWNVFRGKNLFGYDLNYRRVILAGENFTKLYCQGNIRVE
jgi:hypothetical protein